jgi:hypothetical protein
VIVARRGRAPLLALAGATLAVAACGHSGPPLPPLIRIPAAPADFSLVRRGPEVDLTFRVPDANTDRSTPADLSRIDVFAADVPGPVTADDVIRRGTKIKSLPVLEPPDPDQPEPPADAPNAAGLQQKDVTTVRDVLTDSAAGTTYRAYVVVPFNMRGRRGTPSSRLSLPLVPPPPPPVAPQVTYDEKAVHVTWPEVTAPDDAPAYQYAVYRTGGAPPQQPPEPVSEPTFSEEGIEWGKERCYVVRTLSVVEGVRIESTPSPEQCVTFKDTFPPARPEGLVGVGSEGAVSLIWTPNREPDLGGYIVLRAVEPATELTPITAEPIPDTNFRDTVPSGSRVTYAVEAVDKNGNRSEPSETITETAR